MEAVQTMYTAVARDPTRGFHFPTGRAACTFVGYPDAVLDLVPAPVIESFAGVGYPFAAGVIRPGHAVLDIGSGSGTDAMIAAGMTGSAGRVIGVDLTPAMLSRTRGAARSGASTIHFLGGDAERLPLPDASADVVTTNGVLNLVPDKRRAVAEIFRVLRRGGHAQIADIVLGKPVSDACRRDPRLWAECVVGATLEHDYIDMFRSCGFAVTVLSRFDYFAGSASAETREIAAALGAQSLVLRASK